MQIPVDMVVNLMIITIIAHSSQPSQFIYQLGSSVRNPLKYYSIPNWCYQYFLKNPCIRNDGKPIKYQICTLLTTRSSFNRYMNLHYNMPIQVSTMHKKGDKFEEEDVKIMCWLFLDAIYWIEKREGDAQKSHHLKTKGFQKVVQTTPWLWIDT